MGSGNLALSLRRSAGVVDLVLEGAGPSPMLSQGAALGGGWSGELRTGSPTGLRFGPQRVSLPEAGLQSVSLSGAGSAFRLDVVPLAGVPLSMPQVLADGSNLVIRFASATPAPEQTASLDLRQPGMVPQAAIAPPLQPRAVAPPLGDMAVGSMVLRNQSFVAVSGPAVTLTLRNAPAKDALMAIAQLGGYGFVYVGDGPAAAATAPASAAAAPAAPVAAGAAADAGGRPVTIAFRNESYARALNSVLLAAGLQGKTEGNLILAGPNVLGKSFGPQMSKVYRLNQASASSAADYLASLGASITKVTVITNSVTQGTPQANQVAGGSTSQQTSTQNVTTTETYGGGAGPLKGLLGTTDSRLQTITLIGDAGVVAVAEGYLRQIDLRQRQVALSVRILDVTLNNDTDIKNSFAFRSGSNFIVNDNGSLAGVLGGFVPPSSEDVSRQGIPLDTKAEVDKDGGIKWTGPPGVEARGAAGRVGRDGLLTGPAVGGLASGVRPNPGLQYPANQFYDLVRASITATSTKVLASPTMILSENQETLPGGQAVVGQVGASSGAASIGRPYSNEAFVTVGTQVISSYTVQAGQNGAPNTCQPSFATAGLTLGARVQKIDDNGFVTFAISPAVSAATSREAVSGCGPVDILSVRRLDSGSIRVRDGQTLILAGVISDEDIQRVTKWPVLGDIPLIGQFFRASSGGRRKNELVILVTPRIVDDVQGGSYGYGFMPSTGDSRRFMSGSM